MYQPSHFREDDPKTLHALMRAHPLGLLISGGPGLLANPVPFELAVGADGAASLRCHLARPNAQWQALAGAPEVLVVFQGADTYITPSWYETKKRTGKAVPTWNYVTVQARGTARLIEDPAWLLAHLHALTGTHEAGRPEPWAVDDAPPDYIAAQLRGIIGVEIAITALEGKWKVGQNRPEADRLGMLDGLAQTPGQGPATIAGLLRERS